MKKVAPGTGHLIGADTFDEAALAALTEELSFNSYAASFTLARSLARTITVSSGPPNSGKTYQSFLKLAAAASGAYLAPLRLLAVEARDTLLTMGTRANLLTGEDFEAIEGAALTCSTIEMLDQSRPVDMIVIDEAQCLFDPARGWAWTQAILAAPAKELHIICAPYAIEAVSQLLAITGEAFTVVNYERKGDLQLLAQPISVADLQPGDAIVSFSRMDVLTTRDKVMKDTGSAVAVVYGSLPSEVRRREAGRFASGAAPLLSATDAIGQGLNLPIRRVLFTALHKFNGDAVVPLPATEIHQIAGRAGRFGYHETGLVGVLEGCESGALKILGDALAAPPAAPSGFRPTIGLGAWHIRKIAEGLQLTSLADVVDVWSHRLALSGESPFVCECRSSKRAPPSSSTSSTHSHTHTPLYPTPLPSCWRPE